MSWIVIVLAFFAIIFVSAFVLEMLLGSKGNAGRAASPQAMTVKREMPTDIYEAVRLFAKICTECKRKTGYSYEQGGYWGDCITITISSAGNKSHVHGYANGRDLASPAREMQYKGIDAYNDIDNILYDADFDIMLRDVSDAKVIEMVKSQAPVMTADAIWSTDRLSVFFKF